MRTRPGVGLSHSVVPMALGSLILFTSKFSFPLRMPRAAHQEDVGGQEEVTGTMARGARVQCDRLPSLRDPGEAWPLMSSVFLSSWGTLFFKHIAVLLMSIVNYVS